MKLNIRLSLWQYIPFTMLINRDLNDFLMRWKKSPSRLPLILRGARQVGKTTLIKEFGNEYDYFLYFNLELYQDKQLFANIHKGVKSILEILFLSKDIRYSPNSETLIFIDEVQEKPEVIEQLRYFYEEFPHIHIIVTGSLLEFALNKISKVPIGRVEFAILHPLSFKEFLRANQKSALLDAMEKIPFNNSFLEMAKVQFHLYAMLGGMPMIVKQYVEDQNFLRTIELYNAIIESYKADVLKYSKSAKEAIIVKSIVDILPYEIDNRINLSNLSGLPYKALEIKEALQKLEFAGWVQLNYPTTQTQLPIIPDLKKRPRLHFLDIGLVNYQLGIHSEYLKIENLHQLSKGKLIQQIVNQELITLDHLNTKKHTFWVREEKGTTSEVDIVYAYRQNLIPIEIKSGASGTLKSLHEYMDRCNHSLAIRIYAGPLTIDQLVTRNGKTYHLLNLPYFLIAWIDQYLDWFEIQVEN